VSFTESVKGSIFPAQYEFEQGRNIEIEYKNELTEVSKEQYDDYIKNNPGAVEKGLAISEGTRGFIDVRFPQGRFFIVPQPGSDSGDTNTIIENFLKYNKKPFATISKDLQPFIERMPSAPKLRKSYAQSVREAMDEMFSEQELFLFENDINAGFAREYE
ncbi:MAG TPA: hypothetical protein DCM40_45295, partial [Maribacter sp.]|nr:hypothetical protein [Maribacter sp.]